MISLSDVIVFILFGKHKSAKKIITENILQEHSAFISLDVPLKLLKDNEVYSPMKEHTNITTN